MPKITRHGGPSQYVVESSSPTPSTVAVDDEGGERSSLGTPTSAPSASSRTKDSPSEQISNSDLAPTTESPSAKDQTDSSVDSTDSGRSKRATRGKH